jgi:hypothetical protein
MFLKLVLKLPVPTITQWQNEGEVESGEILRNVQGITTGT